MTRRRHRIDDYERWAASRCRRAADDLEVAASSLGELVYEARAPRTLATPAAREAFAQLLADVRALRTRVLALSPLPLTDEA